MPSESELLDAERPRVQVRALQPITAEIDGKPRPLAAGETAETRVAAETTVRVPGVVEVTVRAAKDITEALVAARLDLRRLLAEADVESLEAAAGANERRKDAERTLRDAERIERENLRDLTLEMVDDKIARLRVWVEAYPSERPPEPPLAIGFEAANEAKNEAERLHQEATARLDAARLKALATAGQAEELRAEMAETDVQLRVAADAERTARRELEEEIGYRAGRMIGLGKYAASSGISDEEFLHLSRHRRERRWRASARDH